nr:hypothetical protein [Paenibacillus senegalensis]
MDGTKIEADTNKYSFVWKKSTLRFEEKLKAKVQATLKHIHTITHEETGEYEVESPEEPLDLPNMRPRKLALAIATAAPKWIRTPRLCA